MRFTGVKWLTQGKYRASNCRGWIQIQAVSFQSPHMDPLGYNACHPPSYASWGQRLVNGCRDTKPELLNLSCHRVLWQASLQTSFRNNVFNLLKESNPFYWNSLIKLVKSSQFSSVQSLSRVRLFATPWIAALQASLSITNSRTLPKLRSIESGGDAIQPSHPLSSFSSCPKSLPASESFPMSQLFAWGGQSIGVSALASVFPKNTQDWSPLGWTGWISLQSKGLSRVFSNTTI